ncbi:hypothetical protein P0D69_45420 [Paraburkholderia sediminicola]|uniref:hypothetical protein n=1 Tax=Paraburkholderia sediminicola TaxID=458836 RepID=UPI0038B7E155
MKSRFLTRSVLANTTDSSGFPAHRLATRFTNAPVSRRAALAYVLLGNSEAARRILSPAMPSESVEDDLRFYRELRARYRAQADDGARLAQAAPAVGVTSRGVPK